MLGDHTPTHFHPKAGTGALPRHLAPAREQHLSALTCLESVGPVLRVVLFTFVLEGAGPQLLSGQGASLHQSQCTETAHTQLSYVYPYPCLPSRDKFYQAFLSRN